METKLGTRKFARLAKKAARRNQQRWFEQYERGTQISDESVVVDGVTFLVLGNGAERIALEGPDGVVYKVPHQAEPWATGDQSRVEIELFRELDSRGYSWVPDYWQYESLVLAMRKYGSFDSNWTPETYLEYATIEKSVSDVRPANVGVKPDGHLVLLDGGIRSDEFESDMESQA